MKKPTDEEMKKYYPGAQRLQIISAIAIFAIQVVLYFRYQAFNNPDFPFYRLVGWAFLCAMIAISPQESLPKRAMLATILLTIGVAILAFHAGQTW